MKKIIKKLHNMRFQNKLLLSYLIVVLIPLLLWSYFSYIQNKNFLIQRMQDSYQNIFESTLDNLDGKVQKVETSINLLTHDLVTGEIINNDYASVYTKYYDIRYKLDPLISSMQTTHPEITNITIYTDGDIKNSRNTFYNLEAADNTLLTLVKDSISPEWILDNDKLLVAQKVFSLDNIQNSGIITMEIDSKFIFEKNVPSSLDSYGILIADHLGNTLYSNEKSSNPVFPDIISYQYLIDFSKNNEDIIMLSQKIPSADWTMYMYMDIHSILSEPMRKAFESTVLIIGLSFILILLVIILFSRTFVKRLETLKLSLSQVVKNRFKTDISSEYSDEIGSITNSIGDMVKETNTLINEVYENKIHLREAEIKALQSQINPHFLYNTLSAINWKAINSGNYDISSIVTSLSSFYRATLNLGDKVTTVRDEIINTKAYISIQLSIHNDSFDIFYDISSSILDYQMPNIILQPIVENAIEHGINLKKDGRGIIYINAFDSGNDIIFEVIDNGIGIDDETINNVLVKNKKGYGVKNVNDRLKLFFSDDYGLTFFRMDNGGTKAIIKIPKYVEL